MLKLSIFLLCTLFALSVQAADDTDVADARLWLASNSAGNFLVLNETYLWVAAAVVVFGVAAYLILSEGSALIKNRYDTHQDDGGYYYYQEEPHHHHQKRYANDVASKMAQLETAFKKYQVAEAECEMYIACESSQVHRIEENGPLAKIVFDILSTFNRARDGHKWDSRMEGLVQAFEYGTGAYQQGQVDACQPLRTKCFELKKAY